MTDHHAIIPTEQFVDLTHMTAEERKIYDLAVRRFLAVLYPPCRYESVTVTAEAGGEIFTASGTHILEAGWREVYREEDPEGLKEQMLPDLKKGDYLRGFSCSLKEGKTKPPSRFTEAALLSAMENPVKYMESGDRGLAKTLGETGGLGTVATRADIIEKLFSSFLLEKRGSGDLSDSEGQAAFGAGSGRSEETGADSGVGTEAFGDGERKLKEGCFHEADPGLYPGTSGGNPDRRGHFSS